MTKEQFHAIVTALQRANLPTGQLEAAWQRRYEVRMASNLDIKWGSVPDETPADHLEEVVPLHAGALMGCQYKLTPAQRAVIRERYGITPAPTIQILDKGRCPHSGAVTSIRFKSCEHLDPRRVNLLQALAITHWGEFCEKVHDTEAAMAKVVVEKRTQRASRTPKGPSQEELFQLYAD